MSDFLLKVAEKLKEKGSSLKIDCVSNGISAEWMKKQEEDFVWNGHAEVPQEIFNQYPYLRKIMLDYQGDLDISLQSFTNLYWVSMKSFSHPVIYETDVNLLRALAKLNEKVKYEYLNVIHNFEEQVIRYGENKHLMMIEYVTGNYMLSEAKEDYQIMNSIPASNVHILLSDYEAIRRILQKKKDYLVVKHMENEKFASSIVHKEGFNEVTFCENEQFVNTIELLDQHILKLNRK